MVPPRSARHMPSLSAFLVAVESVVRADGGRVVKEWISTPGPWYDDGYRIHAPTEDSDKRNGRVIVEYKHIEDFNTADARLIAAAPDMFRALDQIETWAEQIEPLTSKSDGYLALVLARCRDALAKAQEERP